MHRHLGDAQPRPAEQHQHPNILVVEQSRLAAGQHLHGLAVVVTKARGQVLKLEARNRLEPTPGQLAQTAHPLRVRPDHHIGLIGLRQQSGQLLHLVLAIGIHGDHGMKTLRQRMANAQLHATPSPQGQDRPRHLRPRLAGQCARVV